MIWWASASERGAQAMRTNNTRRDVLALLLCVPCSHVRYSTAMVGKWHLGHPTVSHWPTHRGFDSFYGFLTSAVDDWNKTSLYSDGWLDLQDGVDLVTDAAELAEHAGLLISRKVVFFSFSSVSLRSSACALPRRVVSPPLVFAHNRVTCIATCCVS